MQVAIVIPAFNEAESLSRLLPEVDAALNGASFQYDIIVVDDGSSDDTAGVSMSLGAVVLGNRRNRGKAAALQAGFDHAADYDAIVTMDADLQDDPAEIPRLVEGLQSADLVSGWKRERQDSFGKRVQSRLFTYFVRLITRIDLHDFNCGLKAYRRAVLDQIRIYGEHHRLIPVLAADAGFEVTEIPVNHRPRRFGRSHYGISRALRGPLDLITILFLSKFGYRPLHVFGATGLVLGTVGVGLGVYLTWVKVFGGEAIGDRPLLMLAILLMLTGLQLFAVGLLGEMLLAMRQRIGGSSHDPAKYRLLRRDSMPDSTDSAARSNDSDGSTPP